MAGIWPVMNQLVGLRTPIPVVSNRSYAEPNAPVRRCIREFVRAWPNLTETTITGVHFIEADSPDEIGTAVARFVRRLRSAQQDGLSDQRSCYMSVHEQPRAPGIFDFPRWLMKMRTRSRNQGAHRFVVQNRLLTTLAPSL
jgi:hypothetical protein